MAKFEVSKDTVDRFTKSGSPSLSPHNVNNLKLDYEDLMNQEGVVENMSQALFNLGFSTFVLGAMTLMNPESNYNTKYSFGGSHVEEPKPDTGTKT